jgi:hypothetical protein
MEKTFGASYAPAWSHSEHRIRCLRLELVLTLMKHFTVTVLARKFILVFWSILSSMALE